MADNNISINPTKSTNLEFDVIVSGIEDSHIPMVRFVIETNDCDFSFKCSKVEGEKNKWQANMPILTHIMLDTVPFRVEVVIDDYFFNTAQGEITFITAPDVHFKTNNTPKPSVTTSFTVKQEADEEEPSKKDGPGTLFTDAEVRARGKKETEKKKVTEDLLETPQGGGGGEITGRYAPTNALLKPEADPTENGRMRGNTSVNDEFTDEDRLSLDKVEDIASAIRPGEGRDYQQEDGKDREGKVADEEEEFDPKKVADDIVKSTLGNLPKSTTKGTLFKRDSSGKTVIKGLEDTKTKEKLKGNAKKVSDILKST